MTMVQLLWCLVAVVAALEAFGALESATAPDGTSYRAVNCFNPVGSGSMGTFDPGAALLALGAAPSGPSCTCSGQRIQT